MVGGSGATGGARYGAFAPHMPTSRIARHARLHGGPLPSTTCRGGGLAPTAGGGCVWVLALVAAGFAPSDVHARLFLMGRPRFESSRAGLPRSGAAARGPTALSGWGGGGRGGHLIAAHQVQCLPSPCLNHVAFRSRCCPTFSSTQSPTCSHGHLPHLHAPRSGARQWSMRGVRCGYWIAGASAQLALAPSCRPPHDISSGHVGPNLDVRRSRRCGPGRYRRGPGLARKACEQSLWAGDPPLRWLRGSRHRRRCHRFAAAHCAQAIAA